MTAPTVATASDARSALAVAIEAQASARAAVEKASAALSRGRRWLETAQRDVEADAAAESARTQQHASAIRAWATGDGPDPSGVDTLEEDSTARAHRAAAKAANAALDGLTASLADAEQQLRGATARVEIAALAVMTAEANEIASELSELQAKRWALRARLEGLGEFWHGTPIAPFKLSLRAKDALADVPPPEWPKPSPLDTAKAAWRKLYQALQTDAEAVID